MECIICGGPVEPWPGGQGYGNNPAPWPTQRVAELLFDNPAYRCCSACNANTVLPLRLATVTLGS